MRQDSHWFATLAFTAALTVTSGGGLGAQAPAADPSARLRDVLPADVAERVLAVIAKARARDLPAAALENRALKFAARGVVPRDIERSVAAHAERLGEAKGALEAGRGRKPTGDEVEAGAEAIRQGVDGAGVSALAKQAPSGRSLVMPLYVIGSLVDRGLPSDEALARVLARLQARATDADLERLPGELPAQARGQANRPEQTGPELAGTKRPAHAGPPKGVPASGGKKTKPKPSGGRP